MSLTDKLTSFKSTSLTGKSNQPIAMYVYCLNEKGINPAFIKYNSIGEARKKRKLLTVLFYCLEILMYHLEVNYIFLSI